MASRNFKSKKFGNCNRFHEHVDEIGSYLNIGHSRANLARFKAWHNMTFVNELPKTATGKIQKYILRTQRRAIAPQ
jgi:hypothetical protein